MLVKEDEDAMTDVYERFAELVVRRQEKKKRECLRCGRLFWSSGAGNRFCIPCSASNQRAGTLAARVVGYNDPPRKKRNNTKKEKKK